MGLASPIDLDLPPDPAAGIDLPARHDPAAGIDLPPDPDRPALHDPGDAIRAYLERTCPAPPRPPGEWIPLSRAARILGRHVGAIKSIALTGAIRVKALPGARTLYSRADCEALAKAG
jgi:hypothetical protein